MEELKIDPRRRNSDSSDVSFLSHRSMDPPIAFKRGGNRPEAKKSRYDAKLINPGPPAVYQLNTERKYIDGTDKKVRQWTYGRRDRNKKNKVLLMVGETGAGKTTLINTMINYILGVKFEDQEWYQITEEEKQDDQTQSQTSEVTVYEVFVEENPTSLTIIDTPGCTNTKGFKREREISEYLGRLFSDKDGVDYIDAVCFVMKAFQSRLFGKELYIFHSVLSLFGKDIKDNIVFLFTHSDEGPPTDALNAIEKAEIPCRRDEDNQPVHFLFNNRQKEKRDKCYEQTYRSAWEMGERSMDTLLKILEDNNRKCFQINLPDKTYQSQLVACIYKLKERIYEKEMEIAKLTDIQKALIIKREIYENAVFPVNIVVKKHVATQSRATSCKICQETCHDERGCWWVSSYTLFMCDVMRGGNCTVCPRNCHYSEHVKEYRKYVQTTETITMTYNDLIKYECNDQGARTTENKTKTEEKVTNDLKMTKRQRSILLNEAYISIMNLMKVPLEGTDVTPEDLDFFITRMKEEEEDKRTQDLDHVRKLIQEHVNTQSRHYMLRKESKDLKSKP